MDEPWKSFVDKSRTCYESVIHFGKYVFACRIGIITWFRPALQHIYIGIQKKPFQIYEVTYYPDLLTCGQFPVIIESIGIIFTYASCRIFRRIYIRIQRGCTEGSFYEIP